MNITEKLNHLREGFVVGHLWTHDLLGQYDKFDMLAIPEYKAKAGEIIYLFNAVGSQYIDPQWLRDTYYPYQDSDTSSNRAVLIDMGIDLYLTLAETGANFADRYGGGDNPPSKDRRDCPLTKIVDRLLDAPRTGQHPSNLLEQLDEILEANTEPEEIED